MWNEFCVAEGLGRPIYELRGYDGSLGMPLAEYNGWLAYQKLKVEKRNRG